MKRIALTALALSALASAPAMAATHHRAVHHDMSSMASEAYASSATQDPYAVVVEGQVVGRDPDAFIRSQLIRDNTLNAN